MAHTDLRIQVQGADLETVLEQPALVAWHHGNHQHMGRAFASDEAQVAKLTLQLARDTTTNQALISFRLPVTLRQAQAKKPKHVFVIVPAEHVAITPAVIAPSDVPSETVRHLGSDTGQSSALLRLTFSLQDAAFAVMPILPRPLERPLQGAPAQLFTLLKSLVEAMKFDVYLQHTGEARDVDWAFDGTTTPHLDLQATYGRGCTGERNIWDQYPCETLASKKWNPLVDVNPPAYDEAVPAQGAVNPSSSPLPAPAPARRFQPPAVPEQGGSGSGSDVLTWNDNAPPSKYKRLPDSAYMRGRKRTLDEANDGAHDDGFLPVSGTPTEKYSSEPDPFQPADLGALLAEASSVDAAVTSLVQLRGVDPQMDAHPLWEMKMWLLAAWRYHPLAHEIYLDRFLSLGACARERRHAGFDAAMAKFQKTFIREANDLVTPAPSAPIPFDFEEQVEYVRGWIAANMGRNAVTVMLGALVSFQDSARDAKEDGSAAVVRVFRERMAMCFVIAFYAFGGRV